MKKIIIFSILFFFINNIYSKTFDDKYIVGVGDVIKLEFPYAQYLSKKYTIDNEGNIYISLFGKIKIQNLTLKQLSNYFSHLYSQHLVKSVVQVKLIKSYKFEQEEQNTEFLSLLDEIKDNFYKRNYSKSLELTEKLSNLIVKVNKLDNKVKKTPIQTLKILTAKFKHKLTNRSNVYSIKGKLKNYSQINYNWVKLNIKFLDNKNKMLIEKNKFIVNDKPIYPSQILDFEIKGVTQPAVVKVKIKITDFNVVVKEYTSKKFPKKEKKSYLK